MSSTLLVSRMYVYSNFLQKYDNLDKEFLTNFDSTCKLCYIKTTFCKELLQSIHFNTVISKEFFTLQKFNLYTAGDKDNKFGSYILSTTLRRSFLYMYVEFLIYNSFKLKNKAFEVNQKYY